MIFQSFAVPLEWYTLKNHQIWVANVAKNEEKPCSACLKPNRLDNEYCNRNQSLNSHRWSKRNFFLYRLYIVVVLPECNALDKARHDKQQNILATVLLSCNKMIQNLKNSAKVGLEILKFCSACNCKTEFFKKGPEEWNKCQKRSLKLSLFTKKKNNCTHISHIALFFHFYNTVSRTARCCTISFFVILPEL